MTKPNASGGPPAPRKTVDLHIKILTRPTDFTIDQMIDAMREVYETAGIAVNRASTETLDIRLPDVEFMNDLDLEGGCSVGTVSEEQTELSSFRDRVPDGEIVVYFCRTLTDGFSGCSTFPQGKPMVVLGQTAPLYTIAHEVGHVLGLKHTTAQSGNRLMTEMGTISLISNPPPVLIKSEIKKMRKSIFAK